MSVAMLFAASVVVAACCSAPRGGNTPQPEPEPFPTAPGEVVPPETHFVDPAYRVPDDFCTSYQERACCLAMTPECTACAETAAAERAQWLELCAPDAPIPTTFDCAAPAPLVPCCRALLPRCTECAARNREVEAAWRAACEKSGPTP
jgi:hypothetical protein